MSDLKELRQKRGTFKTRLTNFTTYLSTIDPAKVTSVQVIELEMRISKLENLYDTDFDQIQTQIEMSLDSDSASNVVTLSNEMAERIKIDTQYYSLLASGKDIIKSFTKADDSDSQSSRRNSNHTSVKLPTIQLPKFSGSYDNWLEFRDTFSSLVHENDEIDDINKFHYLRSSLEGSAAVVIQSMEFSARNYILAWDLLCERYNNKRLLIQNHVSDLFNMESITKESSSLLKCTIDRINKNIRALSTLGEPVYNWDTLLIYIVSHKLDAKTFREWEEYKGTVDKTKSITFTQLIQFMQNRADFLETMELSRQSLNSQSQSSSKINNKIKTLMSVDKNANTSILCPKCNHNHKLYSCPQFLALNTKERLLILPNFKICYNCFNSGHYANQCKRQGCKMCKRKHHTLVHVSDSKPSGTENGASADQRIDNNVKVTLPFIPPSESNGNSAGTGASSRDSALILSANIITNSHANHSGVVLLSTALIKLYDCNNRELLARALLDSGSSSCLMTERLYNQLNLPYIQVDKSIQGINNSVSHIGKMCRVHIKSLNESYCTDLQCFVLPTIAENIPVKQIDVSSLNIPSNLNLCDPNFHTPSAIDIIIGADAFWSLLGSEKISLGEGNPTLCQTRLGWLVCGPIKGGYMSFPSTPIQCNFTKITEYDEKNVSLPLNERDDIQALLTRFWQLEEVCRQSLPYSSEELQCEEHFVKNTTRLPDGRFCVKIPLKESVYVLGDSLQRARRCFLSMERRTQNQPAFSTMYKAFMSEYISLGHMTECNINSENKSVFISHHGVLRESSSTTKLRVVFNASAPTSSGISFNTIQMVGPTVQDDLLSILLRFRMYKYVLSADVEKMYRQVAVHTSDRHLQQIVWRDDPSTELKAYQLNTVTYGTASAPFLATRCLQQIGFECEDQRASEVIIHDFYVDDLLTGENDLGNALTLRETVTSALASACMPLRKWKSNEPALSLEKTAQPSLNLNIGEKELSKTLGLCWDAQSDRLRFPINIPNDIADTKRDMLAVIARIFDPLGLLSPCVIRMKIMIQTLWLEKISWDEKLSHDHKDIIKEWATIINSLPTLNDLQIPRHVVCNSNQDLQLHVFCDASERAYGSCIYVRSVDESTEVHVQLLIAKSRVAPIKPVTIPRLELCAALVGSRLYEKVASSLRDQFSSVTFWTDSMVVLGWLKMLPIKLNTFVRNRVAEILETTNTGIWRHVPTQENPADLISRGVDANAMHLDKWWSGPSFLLGDTKDWPSSRQTQVVLPEIKTEVMLHANIHELSDDKNIIVDFNRFSNFSRLLRTVAYMFRFIHACKKQQPSFSYLSTDELQNALNWIIVQSQKDSFPEYNLLINKQDLPNKSSLLKLNVFLDGEKIMRVGGRLYNSNFPYEKKHPIVIQSTHTFTKLLFRFKHISLMHAGPSLLLATIRESYWPIGGRNLAKRCYHDCVRCRRIKGQTVVPQMGNLPCDRLSPAAYPFQNVGVDYAGPMNAASRQGRGCKLVKVYIALFCCFTTKAIHLELVGDLTSNCYQQALRRFMARRGKPLNVYSDNGSTFVGAYNDISNFLKSIASSLPGELANEGINFHFIPAYAPHFGGLWEAGVKSTKYHLNRVLGNCNLTYEELNTVLTQIEAILNSRPLTPLSSDPDDLSPLTPAHFIIGRPLTSLPVPEYREDSSAHCRTRFQRVEQLRQHFWTRWSKEYISELQQRVKWRACKGTLKLDALVVIKEDNLPPLKWKLGRVVQLHPGRDGIARVADLKTASGLVRRAFSRICPLVDGSG